MPLRPSHLELSPWGPTKVLAEHHLPKARGPLLSHSNRELAMATRPGTGA